MIQKTAVKKQKTAVLSRYICAFNKPAAQRHTNYYCFLSFCFLFSVFRPLNAEELPDPTRPPLSIFAPAATTGQGLTDNHQSGLHTVIISGARRAAIIDGQLVELGSEHGGARLVEVNESGVVLQRAKSRQVLSLFPNVKISRQNSLDKKPAEQKLTGKELTNKESNKTKIKEPLPINKAPSGKHKATPTAPDEELLPRHPKEEK